MFVIGSMGWFGEEKETKPPTKRYCNVLEWYSDQYEAHRSLFQLAIAMSSCALVLAVGVIAVSDWTVRFCLVVVIASAVPGIIYYIIVYSYTVLINLYYILYSPSLYSMLTYHTVPGPLNRHVLLCQQTGGSCGCS